MLIKDLFLYDAVLDLFEGGEGAAPATGGESSASDAGMQTGEATAPEGAEQQSVADPAQTLEERTKQFKELVSGEYKDVYDAEFQKIFNRRFADHKQLQQRVEAQQDVIDRLATKYGVDGTDYEGISKAIDGDTAMWEAEADKAGMTTEQYVQFQNLQRQNAQLIRQEQARFEQAKQQQQVQAWMGEANNVKQKFPGFNLEAELTNPRFTNMLKAGVPMEDAYKTMHFDEIQSATAQASQAITEKAVTDNIRAKGSRPAEAGLQNQGAFSTKTDVSKLTKQDRAEIARRAARGETITFNQ